MKHTHQKILASLFICSTLGCAEAIPIVTLPAPNIDEAPAKTSGSQRSIVLAGGCFWGIEGVFEHVKGVISVTSGYAGGTKETADYQTVSSGATNHAEAVEIIYDPSKVSLGILLNIYFSVAHDPTQLNRQGPDTGKQYRSAIFYSNPEQHKIIQSYIEQLSKSKLFKSPIVTQVTPLKTFYKAENYHQDYMVKNPNQPYIVAHDLPKLNALKKNFPQWVINQ